MNDADIDKLMLNAANSYRMASVWVIGTVSAGAGALGKLFLTLTPAEQTQVIAFVAQYHLWMIPFLTGFVGWYARVHPQNLPVSVAVAKSAEGAPP